MCWGSSDANKRPTNRHSKNVMASSLDERGFITMQSKDLFSLGSTRKP